MNVVFSFNKIAVFLLLLLVFSLPLTSKAVIECEDIPPSNGVPSKELIDLCKNTQTAITINRQTTSTLESTNALDNLAFGWEYVHSDIHSFELSVPEVLTPQGSSEDYPVDELITGCDFDNSGNFQEIYCITQSGYLSASDLDTQVVNEIGIALSYNGEGFSGLATDPTSGIMYASSNDITSSSIYTIDLNTGAATWIGSLTNSPALIAIAFNNQGQLFGYDIQLDSLIKIDKSTGASTVVGSLGFDANFAQGMDFDESNNKCYLFAFNNTTFQAELRTCDTNTGLTQLVGVLGAAGQGGVREVTGAGIVAVRPEISVFPITPGISNIANQITAEGASANGKVAFLWGNSPDSVIFGGTVCNGIEFGIKNLSCLGFQQLLSFKQHL